VQIGRLAVAKRNLRMVEDGNHLRFSFGAISMCCVLLLGQFPQYEHVIPERAGGR